ncbi:uncharacterized protein LOC110233329 [Exaiptasia diaphana]|uniref:Uncharacterized protein n=1 Tax=Exaiptasia diaphana TaxID=2652724 RepID=A0A913WUG1_EXADI|nr:uncharacterized protein LOC110233329 [Exaiptasia diaphana]
MSELKSGETKDVEQKNLFSTRIQNAKQQLERTCRVQSSEFTALCSELLQLNFHSEDGKFNVINNLKQLNGNFVAKIIRKGLASLEKVYSEPKVFEDESIALVELCLSLYSKQQADHREDGQCFPNPALLVDCTAGLCDEILKSKCADGKSSLRSEVILSKCLVELVNLYRVMFSYKLTLFGNLNDYEPSKLQQFFQRTFGSLKQRINDEHFDELIRKTAMIAKEDQKINLNLEENLSWMRNSLLYHWNNLLQLSFVTNLFAIRIAQHDIAFYTDHQSTSDNYEQQIYKESLISRVSSIKYKDMDCNPLCIEDKERQDILFKNKFIFLFQSKLCMKLIQSDVPTTCLEMLFGIFSNNEMSSSPNVEEDKKICQSIMSSLHPWQLDIRLWEYGDLSGRRHQLLMFQVVAEAILSQKDYHAPIERIVKFWRTTFPKNESSYGILTKILVFTILGPKISKEMPYITRPMGFQRIETMKLHHCEVILNNLVDFLSQLPLDILSTTTDWLSLFFCLVKAFPDSWNCQESLKFIEFFSDLEAQGLVEFEEQLRNIITNCFASLNADGQVKTTVLPIIIERLLEDSDLERYKLTLKILTPIAPYMEAENIRKYLSDFITIVRSYDIPPSGETLLIQSGNAVQMFDFSWSSIFRLISVSSSIGEADKEEIFMSHLRLIKNAKDIADLKKIMMLCNDFLILSVNTSSVKQFYHRLENPGNWNSCALVVQCCTVWCGYEYVRLNIFEIGRVYHKREFDDLVTALFNAIDGCLHSSRLFSLFAQVIVPFLSMASSCSAENCQDLVTCVVEWISVGTFDKAEHDLAMVFICTALELRKNEITQMDMLAFYNELIKIIRQKKFVQIEIIGLFLGLQEMLKFPLTFKDITLLIPCVCKLLERGNITSIQEVKHIMFHLFKIPDTKQKNQRRGITNFENLLDCLQSPSLARQLVIPGEERIETSGPFLNIPSSSLKEHFLSVMTMSVEQIHKLSRVPMCSSSSEEMTLLHVISKKSPMSFTHNKSSKLFILLLEKVIANERNAECFIDLVYATIEENVSSQEFEDSLQKVEDMIRIMTPPLEPLMVSCIKECYKIGMKEEHRITTLLLVLKDWKWTREDLGMIISKRNASINIPKQLVRALQTTSWPEEMREKIKKMIKMAYQLTEVEHMEIDAALTQWEFQTFVDNDHLDISNLPTALRACEQACKSDQYVDFFKEIQHSGTDIQEINQYSPGALVCFVTDQLKRLKVAERDLKNTTTKMSETLFKNTQFPFFKKCYCEPTIFPNDTTNTRKTTEKYISLFRDILRHSDFIEEVQHWLALDSIHAFLCKDVIVAAVTWKNGRKTREEALSINKNILDTLNGMTSNGRCYQSLEAPIDVMAEIVRTTEDVCLIKELLQKLADYGKRYISVDCLKTITGWSNSKEIFKFLSKIEEEDSSLTGMITIVPYIGKVFPNSADKVIEQLTSIKETREECDALYLQEITTWSKTMIEAGFSRSVIESWCTSLVLYEKLTSRDVHCIINLTPSTIQLISKEPGEIESCLFTAAAPKTWHNGHSFTKLELQSLKSFKRRLQFAKILDEFASIARMFETNTRFLEKVKDGTHNLCSSFLENQTSSGGMYKVRFNFFKEMFVLLFTTEGGVNEESMSNLTSQIQLSRGLVAVFRRLARSVKYRPVLFDHLKSIVHHTLHYIDNSSQPDHQAIQNVIHKHVIGLEANQDAIHSLQAAGYNQSSPDEDLWACTSIQLSSYVSSVESVLDFRIQRFLKQTWREWRSILTELEIKEVDVNGKRIQTSELMNYSDSLETMESQLEAVKKATENAPAHSWCSNRRRQLMEKEKYVRSSIEKEAKQETKMSGLTKMVISWDNQLFDAVKTCTEKIPGCYAPDGFHSQKPVICGLAIDNRILTLYKQEKRSLTELENVEVKLFPVGMLVYWIHSSGHCYDTDQLWAAFFKMLLVKRLVPKIFLTDMSPGFEWIKRFVSPEKPGRSSEGIAFCSCNTLIPTNEDSYDYEPNHFIRDFYNEMPSDAITELIILTPDDIKMMEFPSLKSPKRNELIRTLMKEVLGAVQSNERLLEKHQHLETQELLIKRLAYAIRKAAEISVDNEVPQLKIISSFIDLDKLSSECGDATIVRENGKDFYAQIILDALQTEMDRHVEYSREYDCCEHAQFLQSNESTPDRDEERL